MTALEEITQECEALDLEDAAIVSQLAMLPYTEIGAIAESLPNNDNSIRLLGLAKRYIYASEGKVKLTRITILNCESQKRTKIEIEKPPIGWEVVTSEQSDFHELCFEGKAKASMRGNNGLKVLQNCAEVFNRNGSKPGKKLRIACAADAKNAADFLQKRSHHSPELPIETPTPVPTIMPAKSKTTAEPTAPIVQEFPASHFVRFPTNRTIDEESIVRMHDSVKDVGIINPLIARPIPGKPELEIIAGETRWLGCKRIDPEFMVPTFLKELSDKEAAKIHAIDNFQRKDLNPLEEGREIQHMLDCGWNFDEVMAHLGKAKDYLYTRLQMLKMPDSGKAAFLDGNLSLHTVRKIMMLPEDVREKAIVAVTEPKHAASALPEREARELIEREFVRPMEKAAEWEGKKKLLMKENPGAVWLEYEKAAKAGSNFTLASNTPYWDVLSDAARQNELKVPTWLELAQKHGSPIYLGLNYSGEPALYVSIEPIMDAEKAAMEEKPEECIFTHPKAVQKTRDAAEQRKLAEANKRAAAQAERKKMQCLILAPDGIKPTAFKKFIEITYMDLMGNCLVLEDLMKIFEIEDGVDAEEKADKAVTKYIKSKSIPPLEGYTRMVIAASLEPGVAIYVVVDGLFESGAIKAADFPVNHADFETRKANAEKERAASDAKLALANQEKADGIARGEEEAA